MRLCLFVQALSTIFGYFRKKNTEYSLTFSCILARYNGCISVAARVFCWTYLSLYAEKIPGNSGFIRLKIAAGIFVQGVAGWASLTAPARRTLPQQPPAGQWRSWQSHRAGGGVHHPVQRQLEAIFNAQFVE